MEKQIYNVTTLNQYIKNLIEGDFLLSNVLVKGEICNLNKHYTGHYYFSIKDEESKISCMMFSFNVRSLKFDLKNGDEVLINGHVSVYDKNGTYQLYAHKIEQYGKGKELLKLLELKKKLLEEGIFNLPKKEIPLFPKTIGIITSKTGAAVHDLIHTIQSRYNPKIYVFPCLVQGEGAPQSIINALKEALNYQLDTLIISRGGGANEDLMAFNNEELVRFVSTIEVPLITAVGHQIDSTLIDLVADYACITPTEAGIKATPNKDELLSYIKHLSNYSTQLMKNCLDRIKNRYLKSYSLIKTYNPLSLYQLKIKDVKNKQIRLNQLIININLSYRHRLETCLSSLRSLNPYQILDKGYSLVYLNDKIINKVSLLELGDELSLKMSDGTIKVKVIDK
ncbi:MAG: exodeoxyribonuclease VII large subunit [Bacillales bacterium]|nr:exodeoxyribonuclease VII large subunit [Bacillales bacterium]